MPLMPLLAAKLAIERKALLKLIPKKRIEPKLTRHHNRLQQVGLPVLNYHHTPDLKHLEIFEEAGGVEVALRHGRPR